MKRETLKRLLVGGFSVRRMLLSILFIYLCLCLFAWFAADRMIFLPPPASYRDGGDILKIQVADGIRIAALHLPNPQARFTILYSHGNAEDLGALSPYLKEYRLRGYAVFAYDYEGYGTGDGTATEKTSYRDVLAAYRYLREQLQVPADRILVLGRSVGGGPAVELARREPVAGLILESAFVSAFRVLTRWPVFPFDKFNNLAKIRQVTRPLLMVHGRRDRVIPFWHGQTLFARANEPKAALWVGEADHNDLVEVAGEDYWRALQQWTAKLP